MYVSEKESHIRPSYGEGTFKGGNGMQVTCLRLALFAIMNFLVVGYIFGGIGFVASPLVWKFPLCVRMAIMGKYDHWTLERLHLRQKLSCRKTKYNV